MNVGFLHYHFVPDGVSRVVLGNAAGLLELPKGVKPVLIAPEFSIAIPAGVSTELVDFSGSSANILSSLRQATRSLDALVIENPTIGNNPAASYAFANFARQSDIPVVYRVHDLPDDRPKKLSALESYLSSIGDSLSSLYPSCASYVALTSHDAQRLRSKGCADVSVLPNPVLPDEFVSSEDSRESLRSSLRCAGMLASGESSVVYPVRVLDRKNIEEALLVTKALNAYAPHRLLVTLSHNASYGAALSELATRHGVSCVLGGVSDVLDASGSSIGDLFGVADAVLSTSVREGFGYAFVEPWYAGVPMFGRDIPSVTDDFKQHGLFLDHLYGDAEFFASEDVDARLRSVDALLSSPSRFNAFVDSMAFPDRLVSASAALTRNRDVVLRSFDYRSVASELYNLFNK